MLSTPIRPAPTDRRGLRARRAAGVAGLVLLAGCAVASTDPAPPEAATYLVVRPDELSDVEIVAEKSMPPKFSIVLERDMPTPGWTFEVDEIEVLREEGRIVARVTEIGPSGITSQVITPTELKLDLGTVPPGKWSLELRTRKDRSKPHRLEGTLTLLATHTPQPGS
jgi:hypothetical protein